MNDIKTEVLKDINISFKDKGLVYILGKSGSGKTTLLNLIAGLDKTTEGEILDGDLNISTLNSNELNEYRKNNIGFIFQNYNLVNTLNVIDNIFLGVVKTPEKLKIALKYLKELELEGYENSIVNNLSGGQQQRVAIIRALVKDSKLILADEPTGNLDTANGIQIYKLLQKIAKEHLVIVVSHDEKSAYEYGERVIVIQDGKIKEDLVQNETEKPIGIDIQNYHENIQQSTAFKVSKKFMLSSKVKLVLNSIIVSLLLSFVGLFIMFTNYDFSNISVKIFYNEKTSTIGIGKGYVDKQTKKFIQSFRIINQDEKKELLEENKLDSLDSKYLLNGMIIKNNDTGSEYIPSTVSYAMVSSENNLNNYGLSMESGKYPSKGTEVAITDYLAYTISLVRPELITDILGIDSITDINNEKTLKSCMKKMSPNKLIQIFGDDYKEQIQKSETIKKIQDNPGILLLNSKIDFITNSYKISGIIETNFETKYKNYVYMDENKIRRQKDYALFNFNFGNYYCNFYVTDSFLNNIYKDKIIFQDCVYLKASEWCENLGIKDSIEGQYAYLSNNYFRKHFETEYNKADMESYTMPNMVYIPLGKGMDDDIIYKDEDFIVKGIFDLPYKYQDLLANNQIIVASDTFFDNFSKAQVYSSYIYVKLPKAAESCISLLQYLDKHDLYYITPSAQSVYSLTEILNIFRSVFGVICIILIALTIVFLSTYFNDIVTKRIKEIGIMRSIGMRKRDIYKIFEYCGIEFLVAAISLSYAFTFILVRATNILLVKSYLRYIDNKVVKGLSAINISPEVILVIPSICIILLILSILYSVRRISKLDTITAIKSQE